MGVRVNTVGRRGGGDSGWYNVGNGRTTEVGQIAVVWLDSDEGSRCAGCSEGCA